MKKVFEKEITIQKLKYNKNGIEIVIPEQCLSLFDKKEVYQTVSIFPNILMMCEKFKRNPDKVKSFRSDFNTNNKFIISFYGEDDLYIDNKEIIYLKDNKCNMEILNTYKVIVHRDFLEKYTNFYKNEDEDNTKYRFIFSNDLFNEIKKTLKNKDLDNIILLSDECISIEVSLYVDAQ